MTSMDLRNPGLRGLEGATGEWTLHALCHNLRKLANSGVRPRSLASARTQVASGGSSDPSYGPW